MVAVGGSKVEYALYSSVKSEVSREYMYEAFFANHIDQYSSRARSTKHTLASSGGAYLSEASKVSYDAAIYIVTCLLKGAELCICAFAFACASWLCGSVARQG